MTKRHIANEVLDGLHAIREHRNRRRTLRTTQIESRPLPELSPSAIREIRDRLDVSRAVSAHMIRTRPDSRRLGAGQVSAGGVCGGIDADGGKVPGHVR
ncbi:MAG: hypothetical protein OXH09_14700 [Gammaproteobacteria bacterium]|nr:hypothetical protein [Gammaproteobacteria bacterium]